MSKTAQIRINDLARELEVKAKVIIDLLPGFGVAEKKTHSSSVDVDVAEKVRKKLAGSDEPEPVPAPPADPKPAPAAAKPVAPAPLVAPRPVSVPPITKPAAPAGAVAVKPALIPGAPIVARPAAPPAATPARPAVPGAPAAAPRPAMAGAVAAKPAAAAPAAAGKPGVAPAKPVPGKPIVSRPTISSPPPKPIVMPGQPIVKLGPRATPTFRPGQPGARPAPGQRPPIRPGAPGQSFPPRPGMPPRSGARPGAPGSAPAPEPGKPIYQRKPSRGRHAVDKKFDEGERRLHPVRSRPGAGRGPYVAVPVAPPVPREPREISFTEGVTVRELSEKLDVRAKELQKVLLDKGIFATINQALDVQTATDLAQAFNGVVSVLSLEEDAVMEVAKEEKAGDLSPRAPVVTVMGHVDHGKTSLLDALRHTEVAEGEAGGITQHIGASEVSIGSRRVVFIDTPGHEAFTRMRARGAKVTDIVVLVVAADDGIMPQTKEAIDHARAAKVPIVVAVNKIDKPEAQPERVKRQLTDAGLMPEDWGGDTVVVEVSAKQKKNLDRLLEMILLVADLRELKANPTAPASGTVLESRVDRGRGPVATVLVQNGTLATGDFFLCGAVFGKVRALFDYRGQLVKEALPSTPVEVLGLQGVPEAGDHFQVADEARARHITDYRQAKRREAAMARTTGARITLDQLHEQLKAGEVKELPIVLKCDVQGSVEVLSEMLPKLSTDQVKLKIIHASVGAVAETDVNLAVASGAVIIAFNVRPERKAAELAQQESIDIRLHTIIYELQDELKKALAGLLAPVFKESYLGRAEVRNTFRIKGVGMIAGCYVQDGLIKRDADVRVLRDNVVIYTGKVASLRRFKDDASEVRTGFECGIGVSNFADVKVGDVLECFTVQKVSAAEASAS
jgi:translation initiation factor IF-2